MAQKIKGKVIGRSELNKRLAQLEADILATEMSKRGPGWKNGDGSKDNEWWDHVLEYGIRNMRAELSNMKALGYK